jgi:hypothetical protein
MKCNTSGKSIGTVTDTYYMHNFMYYLITPSKKHKHAANLLPDKSVL